MHFCPGPASRRLLLCSAPARLSRTGAAETFTSVFSPTLAEDCQADGTDSYVVPIAVGIALLILILIVVLAYFIGRKRNMAAGYQSF